MRMSRLSALALMLTATACSQTPPPAAPVAKAWPSAAQVELVTQRRASFPVQSLVTSIDWYQPQEVVRGGNAAPFEPVASPSIRADALAAAEALAVEQESHALLIWRGGRLELEHYWNGHNRTTRFETASMAKSVVALAMGAAVQAGKLRSVDDPLGRYVPWEKTTARGALPLRAYLEMASGIESPSFSSANDGPYWQYAFGDDLREAVARWPDGCAPRTEFCYANANTAMLGWAIEGATGTRYADWLSRSIWQPIGAGNASLWLDRAGGSPRYSCCLIASGQDWLRVGLLVLNKGKVGGKQIIAADWIDRMTAPSPANANYGWQIWRGNPHNPARTYGKAIRAVVPAKQPFARDDVVYFDGSAGQRVYIIPSEQMVIVRIGQPQMDWDDSALPNAVLAGI